LAFRPLLSDSSMKSKWGSQALAEGPRPGAGTGAGPGDTSLAGVEAGVAGSAANSGDASLAGFAGARRPQLPGARMATPAAFR